MKEEIKSKVFLVLGVLIVIVGTYFITAIFMTKEIGNKDSKNDDVTDNTPGLSLSYSNIIIAGDVFNIKKDKYMVLFFSEKDTHDYIKNTFKLYDTNDDNLILYKVNTDEAINSFVKADESNDSATNAHELKIKGDTLITIENGKIVSYIDNEDEILEALK